MDHFISRRQLLRDGAVLATLAFAPSPLSALARLDGAEGGAPLPFLDPQPPGHMLRWEELTEWVTPTRDVFAVSHYGTPAVDPATWSLTVSGLVKTPRRFTIDELRARPRAEVVAALECSGNGAGAGFMGAIGNLKWAGTPLAPLLKDCGLDERAIEVVFFGADEKVEKIRDKEYLQNFARSLSVEDSLRQEVLLAYEMNGEPLAKEHGAPLRLIVPGWFGIAWVKWLSRIEVLDRRYMNRFMARDYVTIRGEERDGKTIWRETSVGPIDVKSIIARAVKLQDGTVRISGAAWTDGTPLRSVEVQVDGGPWAPARLDEKPADRYAWTFWSHDLKGLPPGEHTLLSRAADARGRIQPAADDPSIKLKRTYWEANEQVPRRIRIEKTKVF
jgi:DMSO/TMAO reductase YedYZ molybdopterin-dependent catalytic subunit